MRDRATRMDDAATSATPPEPATPRPAVLAYDGSEPAIAALREAVALLGARPLLIATVWEPGLAAMPATSPDASMLGVASTPIDPETMLAVDRAQSEHAAHVADAGVRLARELGATAEPVVLDDEGDVASTLATLADGRDAAVIVVGSRGHSGLRARVLGSTTKRLVHHAGRPVLVVHE
jgi:nucleotide-binding universal stress UspA family protein